MFLVSTKSRGFKFSPYKILMVTLVFQNIILTPFQNTCPFCRNCSNQKTK